MAASLTIKALQIRYRLLGILKRFIGNGSKVYVADRVPFYESMWREAAAALSADFQSLDRSIWEVRLGRCVTRIDNYKVQLDDPVTLAMAGNKALCHNILRQHAVPVPEHLQFNLDGLDRALDFADRHSGCFVVKPTIDTAAGVGVTTHLKTHKEIRRAAVLASTYSDRLLIERLIPGELYRLLFLDGKLITASKRMGIKIVGDGQASIGELARGKMGADNDAMNDRDYMATLEAQGIAEDDIPEKGQKILVKSYDRSIGTDQEAVPTYNKDVTERIGTAVTRSAGQAVKSIGSVFAGVDMIMLDPAAPLEESGGKVIEVNTTPGLHHHYNLVNDSRPIQPATIVLKHLLSERLAQ